MSLIYWLLPIIFAGTDPYNAGKLAFYMIFQLISNLNGSMCNISRTGMLSTITPNVIERTRLITQASLFSGFIEKWPEIFMGLLIDLINHGKLKIPMRVNYYYINVLGFASMTTVVGIPGAFVSPTSYAFVTKAR